MNVDIRGLGVFCTAALSEHARRRLQFALAIHGDCIQQVMVRLGNEHGPPGEFNKFCRIQVHLADAPVVVIRDSGHDLRTVIDRAADRAGRVVVEQLRGARLGRRQTRSGPTCSVDISAGTSNLVSGEPRT